MSQELTRLTMEISDHRLSDFSIVNERIFPKRIGSGGAPCICPEKAGKLVIKVEPAYTSQRCPKCGRVERKNRPSQSVFRCVSCGFESANADYVAAGNILMAGVKLIREGRLEPKKVKATLRGKPAKATNIKLGPGWADVMPVEPERCQGKLRCQTRYEAGSPSFQ